MARLRTRIKRSFLVLVAVCVLALLLEMNRFLPGDWAGGSGGGFQAAHTLGRDTSNRERASETPDERPDATVVLPPEAPPEDWPPREGLRIELRGPDGEAETNWRLGTGMNGKEDVEPDGRGEAHTNADEVFREGFRVRTGNRLIRHAHGLDEPAAKWVVQRPSGKLPAQRAPGRAGVRVVDAETGEPIESASVTWQAGEREQKAETDATGEAVVRGARDGGPAHVEISAENYETRREWVSPREGHARSVELEPMAELRTRYEHADDTHGTPQWAILVGPDGQPIGAPAQVTAGTEESGHYLVMRVPRRDLDGAWLETMVTTESGTFVFRIPTSEVGAVTTIPAWRAFIVRFRDVHGEAFPDFVSILLDYGTYAGSAEEPRNVHGGGSKQTGPDTYDVVVPREAHVGLLAEPPGAQPIVRRLTPIDASDTLEFVGEPGIGIPILVSGPDGKPVEGAWLVGRASVDGMRVIRRGETGPSGRTGVGPFGPGPVELFVRAEHHADRAVLVEAKPGMGTVAVELRRGYPLTVIVEDPFGIPLEGVEVSVTPADGGVPLVSSPDENEWRTDDRGLLRIEHLPNRLYEVTLSLPGHESEKLRRVQPGAVTYFATLLRTN